MREHQACSAISNCYRTTSETRRQQKASSWVWARDSKPDISVHLLIDQERLRVHRPQHPMWSRRGKCQSTLNAMRSRRLRRLQRSRLTILSAVICQEYRREICTFYNTAKSRLGRGTTRVKGPGASVNKVIGWRNYSYAQRCASAVSAYGSYCGREEVEWHRMHRSLMILLYETETEACLQDILVKYLDCLDTFM